MVPKRAFPHLWTLPGKASKSLKTIIIHFLGLFISLPKSYLDPTLAHIDLFCCKWDLSQNFLLLFCLRRKKEPSKICLQIFCQKIS